MQVQAQVQISLPCGLIFSSVYQGNVLNGSGGLPTPFHLSRYIFCNSFLFVTAMVKLNPPPDSYASSLLPNSWMCPLVTKNKGVPSPPSVNVTVDQSLPSDEVKHVFDANSMG